MSCLKAGHILSNGLKITIFCFSSVVNVNQIWNTGKNWSFAILQRQHVCTASYSYRVKILVTGFLFKRFIMANFNPYQFTNLRYSPDYSQYGDGLFAPFGSQIFSTSASAKLSIWRTSTKKRRTGIVGKVGEMLLSIRNHETSGDRVWKNKQKYNHT